MQTYKQKQLLARWRDRSFQYHPADSHDDASQFRDRMRAYGRPEAEPKVESNAAITTLGAMLRTRKGK
jgi:hypothetical protein